MATVTVMMPVKGLSLSITAMRKTERICHDIRSVHKVVNNGDFGEIVIGVAGCGKQLSMVVPSLDVPVKPCKLCAKNTEPSSTIGVLLSGEASPLWSRERCDEWVRRYAWTWSCLEREERWAYQAWLTGGLPPKPSANFPTTVTPPAPSGQISWM